MGLKTTFQKPNCILITPYLQENFASKEKKGSSVYNTMRTTITTIVCSLLFVCLTYGQNCSANIAVQDNGNIDSVSTEGLFYNMQISNSGNSSDTYLLSTNNYNTKIKNPDDSPNNSNVILDTVFLDSQKNQINQITVNPGATVHFYAKITIPAGTTLSKWSNSQIVATSSNCNTYSVNTVLHTYVLNPSND